MPEDDRHLADRRLDVWRRAYALMDRRFEFSGPFYDAGYRDIQIEPTLDNESKPDMVSVSDSHIALMEISCGRNKKFHSMRDYASGDLTPALRARFGDKPRTSSGSPFFVTNTSGFRSFPSEMNAIRLSDPVECRLPKVTDIQLRDLLLNWTGFPGPPPAYGLKALPESGIEEVKFPLAGIIKAAASKGGRVTANEMTTLLLGELAPSVSQSGRTRLVKNVATLLELAAFHLKDFARWDPQGKALVMSVVDSTPAKKKFSKALSDWLGTRFLESFSLEPEEGDEETYEDA